MAHKKKGQLTSSNEWARHLRKYLKQQFWKGERSAAKGLIRSELNDVQEEFETIVLWADFDNNCKTGIRLNSSGTIEDLKLQQIDLVDGMKLTLWMEKDKDETLVIDAIAQFNKDEQVWEASCSIDEVQRIKTSHFAQ